jgi:hypothetical protein
LVAGRTISFTLDITIEFIMVALSSASAMMQSLKRPQRLALALER